MQSCYHVAGHDFDLLESFVHDCIQQLPKLQSATDQHLPPRCTAYHTACSSMLKQVLLVLEQLSPRLCRLIAQIWDLTSLNFFVLIQLAHATIEKNEQLHVKSRNAEHFHQEMMAQQTQRLQRHEIDFDRMRLETQNLRAELQKTRQKQNRLAVENSQLRLAISGLVDTQDPLSESAVGGGFIAHVDFEDDVAVVGDAEEREFYGVNGDELHKIEKIHPIESLSQDLELLFQGLEGQERQQMTTLNDLDRFINSNTVSLLWQYGSSEEEHRLMQRMMNARTIGSQTDAVEPERRYSSSNSNNNTSGDGNANTVQSNEEDNRASAYASGETGNATLVTKRQTIPASLRAQLQTRPKIQRVLEKDQLNHIILRLYLEKLDADAMAVRARKPRAELHQFMKQFFLERYAIAPLADYHMMEVVKSCLYYNEHLEIEHRKIKALGLPTARLAGCYPLHDSSNQFNASDIRVALFSRVCELVPPELADVPVGGNLFSCLLNVLVDMIGDVVELDGSMSSLEQVFRLPTEDQWECSCVLALALLSHHLVFAERSVLEEACARVSQLAVGTSKTHPHGDGGARIAVDVFLAIFISTWLEHDQRLTRKLRDGFKRQLVALSLFASADHGKASTGKGKTKHDPSDSDSTAQQQQQLLQLQLQLQLLAHTAPPKESPLESLMRICSSLPDESLSPLDLDELRIKFQQIVEANRELVDPGRGRKKTSVKKASIVLVAPAVVCIGGVSEKEFVSTAVEILRKRRNCFGIRIHSRLLSMAPTRMSQLGVSRQLVALIASHEHDGDLPLELLKPGLEPANPDKRRKGNKSALEAKSETQTDQINRSRDGTAAHALCPRLHEQQQQHGAGNQSVFETWRKSELLQASRDLSPEKDDASLTIMNKDNGEADEDSEDREEERGRRDSTEVEDELELQQDLTTTTTAREVSELRVCYSQLQDDVEVLAAHLEKQTMEHTKERGAMHLLQNQLQYANVEMVRELHSLRIENEALRHQNVLLQHQRDEFEQRATLAAETQEELLLALQKQKEIEEQLQNANVHIIRERAQVRKSLETTQNHCRRLEEELAAIQTHLMQLQSERKALQVAAAATNSTKHNREAEQIKAQEEMISSLRADLLQMEFEYKTLTVDRETLTEKLSKLQKRVNGGSESGGGSSSYDVIPLDKGPLSSKQQKQLQKDQEKQQKFQQQQQQKLQTLKKNIRPARSHYESENGGFSGVMELPNFVGDRQDSSSDINLSSSSLSQSSSSISSSSTSVATTAPVEKGGELRRRSSFSALVSKTVSSAKKKLFVPSQNKNVLPQQ